MEDILQQGGQITLTALGSLAALFLLTKLSGNKQVSQMNLFDYVMGITIGSIAAEMASELESPLRPLWAMVVYGLTAWGIALLTNRSIRVRRFITGKPLILMDSGVIYRKNLRRARMDLNEFLMYCRVSGYFDLNQIQTAILEHNGTGQTFCWVSSPAGCSSQLQGQDSPSFLAALAASNSPMRSLEAMTAATTSFTASGTSPSYSDTNHSPMAR